MNRDGIKKHWLLFTKWLGGAQIQAMSRDGWYDIDNISWASHIEYRVKPDPQKIICYMVFVQRNHIWTYKGSWANKEVAENYCKNANPLTYKIVEHVEIFEE